MSESMTKYLILLRDMPENLWALLAMSTVIVVMGCFVLIEIRIAYRKTWKPRTTNLPAMATKREDL